MLRFTLLIVIIFFTTSFLHAQPKHATRYLSDSTWVLLEKGSKKAVYSTVQDEIVVPYQKHVNFVELEGTPFLFRMEEDTFTIYLTDNSEIDNITTEYRDELMTERFRLGTVDEGIFLLNYSKPPKFGEKYDRIELIDQGIQRSGVYSYYEDKWLIPPVYLNVMGFNDHFICRKLKPIKIGEDFTRSAEKNYVYDIYTYDEGPQRMTLFREGVGEFDPSIIQTVLELDSLSYKKDETTFVAWREENAAYIRFYMPFTAFVSLDDQEGFSPEAKPTHFEKILDFDYDFIGISSQFDFVITFDQKAGDSALVLYKMNEEGMLETRKKASKQLLLNQQWQVDHHFWIDGNYVEAEVPEPPYEEMGFSESVFGIKSIRDNEIIFINSVFDAVNFEAFDEYGEIMVNAEGDYVYQIDIIDEQHAGVFDLTNHEWVVPQDYHDIISLKNGWALGKYDQPEFISSNLLYPRYEIVSENLQLIEPNLILEDLLIDSSFIFNDLPIQGLEKIFAAPSSDDSWLDNISSEYYLRFEDGQLGYYEADPYHPEGYSIERSNGFIYMNRKEDLRLELKDQKFHLILQNDTLSSAFGGWLQINTFGRALYAEQFESFYHLTYFNPSGDTLVKTNIPEIHDFPLFHKKDYTYEVMLEGERLIVNEQRDVKQSVYDLWGNYYECDIDLKGAAIWERDNEGWTKLSPYYGKIESLGNGYLCKTAGSTGMPKMDEMEGEFVYNDNYEPQLEQVIESRFLVFDKDMKAVHFLDHYDFEDAKDLGYGIALKTSSGWMFVNYELKPITTDEWDEFEKSGNQLRAIKLRDSYDEFGNILFDEEGNPIDPLLEEKFFDLTK